MAIRTTTFVATAIRSAARTVPPEATDRELLDRYVDGDETAFAALAARHTPMVLGVCRRALPTVQDAEDACQAAFLILARKARSGGWQPSIANWLYTTARRVAAKALRTAERRTTRESRVARPADPSALDQMTGREAFAALDEELDRLPPRYREPLVLCYLQGLTRDEAAVRLGVSPATLKSQLDRGRKRLGTALTKRGVALGAGLLACASTSPAGASPPRFVESIVAAVAGSPPANVAALAEGVAVNGVFKKALRILAVAGMVGLGLGAMPTPGGQSKGPPPAAPELRESRPAGEKAFSG